MWWVITEDVCVCAASVLKNELQKVVQYRKGSKKRNAGGQPSAFSKDLKVRKQDFIHVYFCLYQFRRTSSQTNALLITFIVCSYCKCRKAHCFHTCWLMLPPSTHFLSNKPHGPPLAEVTAVGFTKREWTSFIYRLLQKRDWRVSKAITVIVFCTTQTARWFFDADLPKCATSAKNRTGLQTQSCFLKVEKLKYFRFLLRNISSVFVTSFNRFRMTFDWQSSRFLLFWFFFASQSLAKLAVWRMIATRNRRKLIELVDLCFPEYLSIYLMSYVL